MCMFSLLARLEVRGTIWNERTRVCRGVAVMVSLRTDNLQLYGCA